MMNKPMIVLLAALILPFPAAAETPREKAARILDSIDEMWRGDSSHGIMLMRVKTRNYSRSLKMEGWSKGKDRSLVRIILPLKEKDAATLKSGNDIFTYLPQTDRTIRLTSGMMMGSWMGSHFTNDDLVKESRMLDDYFAEITFAGTRDGMNIMEFTLMPKPESAVVWGKIILSVKDENIPVKEIYYDEEMNIARTMTFTGLKNFSGRTIPAVLKVVPSDKPDEYTEVVHESLEFDIKLPDELFSLASLRKK
ncbi:MAG: outer membrane lipoprotein-sorting protein [Nitrospinae bacterium]|nr:outer membrane lipoprotein-sorting protein [Nitrospinota bacterium]